MLKSASTILCAVVVVSGTSERLFCYDYTYHYCFDFWGQEFFGENSESTDCKENARFNDTYDQSITKFYIDETNIGKIFKKHTIYKVSFDGSKAHGTHFEKFLHGLETYINYAI